MSNPNSSVQAVKRTTDERKGQIIGSARGVDKSGRIVGRPKAPGVVGVANKSQGNSLNRSDDLWVTIDSKLLMEALKLGADDSTSVVAKADTSDDNSPSRASDSNETSAFDENGVGPNSDLKSSQDKKLCVSSTTVPRSLLTRKLLAGVLMGNGKGGNMKNGFYFRTKTHYGTSITSNSSTGKYMCLIGGASGLAVNTISGSAEWSAFNTLFEEFFIHSMNLRFEPNNQFLYGYTNATTTNLQSCMLVVAGYQHDQGTPTDASNNFYTFSNSSQHKICNTGKPWTFTWKNVDKFSKDAPVGDATTAQNSQQWLNIGDVAKYGGSFYACTPYATNAAPNYQLWATNAYFGTLQVTYDVSFRYRD